MCGCVGVWLCGFGVVCGVCVVCMCVVFVCGACVCMCVHVCVWCCLCVVCVWGCGGVCDGRKKVGHNICIYS